MFRCHLVSFCVCYLYSTLRLPRPDANLAEASRLPKPDANFADANRLPRVPTNKKKTYYYHYHKYADKIRVRCRSSRRPVSLPFQYC